MKKIKGMIFCKSSDDFLLLRKLFKVSCSSINGIIPNNEHSVMGIPVHLNKKKENKGVVFANIRINERGNLELLNTLTTKIRRTNRRWT